MDQEVVLMLAEARRLRAQAIEFHAKADTLEAGAQVILASGSSTSGECTHPADKRIDASSMGFTRWHCGVEGCDYIHEEPDGGEADGQS